MTHSAADRFQVRPAVSGDARGIAVVHVRAWQEAYASQLPAEFLAGLDVDQRVPRWVSIIEDDVTDVFVAEADGAIVGWATSSIGRDKDRPVERELAGIYVLESVYGMGAGQSLLASAITDKPAYLWILDENPRAEAFYRRNGFERDGGVREQRIGGVSLQVVRMVRRGG